MENFPWRFLTRVIVPKPSQLVSEAPVRRANQKTAYIPSGTSNKQINSHDGENMS